MKELFEQILHALERGENVVLCSILASSGSAPRGAARRWRCSRTAPRSGPSAAARSSALRSSRRWSFSGRARRIVRRRLAPNQINDIGMICGGTVMVYFRFFDHCSPQDAALVRAILELLQSGRTPGLSAAWSREKSPPWEPSTKPKGFASRSWTSRCCAPGLPAARSIRRASRLIMSSRSAAREESTSSAADMWEGHWCRCWQMSASA